MYSFFRKENRQRKCETVADRWRVIIVYRTTRAVMINNNSVFMDVGLTAGVMCVYFEKCGKVWDSYSFMALWRWL